jgi:hypothetical protein
MTTEKLDSAIDLYGAIGKVNHKIEKIYSMIDDKDFSFSTKEKGKYDTDEKLGIPDEFIEEMLKKTLNYHSEVKAKLELQFETL